MEFKKLQMSRKFEQNPCRNEEEKPLVILYKIIMIAKVVKCKPDTECKMLGLRPISHQRALYATVQHVRSSSDGERGILESFPRFIRTTQGLV